MASNVWKVTSKSLSLENPLLMGILNVTPDSFSDGGQLNSISDLADRARAMAEGGVDIFDLGAESSRPGAETISEEEELNRLLPALEFLLQNYNCAISIDTTKPGVARVCLKKGAHIINDISALKESGREMAEVVSEFQAGLVLMHRRGDAITMQTLTRYDDLIRDIKSELQESVDIALECGVQKEAIAIDPGIGFSKTAEQNIEILRRIEEFKALGYPVLLGASRKSFIQTLTGKDVANRDFATAAVIADAVKKGIAILRVHHVAAMHDVIKVTQAIQGEQHVRA